MIGRAVGPGQKRKALPADVAELVDILGSYVATAMARFEGVDRAASGFEQLYAAQERLADHEARDAFAEEFLRAQGLFEFLWPDTAIRPYEGDYKCWPGSTGRSPPRMPPTSCSDTCACRANYHFGSVFHQG
jgi:hypothetical protein